MAGDNNESDNGILSSSTYAELTEFQRDILIILAGNPDVKGLFIKEELEQYYEDTIHHGRLYPNLDTLVDEGLVDKFELDKRSNGYRLTEDGILLLDNRLTWQSNKASGGHQGESVSDTEQSTETADESETEPQPEDTDVLSEIRSEFNDEL